MTMITTRKKRTTLALVACLLALIVISLGSWTRLKHSGLGCPDWPTCYGYFDVRNAITHVDSVNTVNAGSLRAAEKTIPEMVHRYCASLLGLLVLIITASCLIKYKSENTPLKLPLFLSGLIIFQGILGKWTVTMGLYPPTVTGHLLGGFLTLTLLCILTCRLGNLIRIPNDASAIPLIPWVITAIGITLTQIALGGWTAANYAAVSCTEFPICESGWAGNLDFVNAFKFWGFEHVRDFEFGVLDLNARTTIHIFHRFGAIITLLTVGFVAIKLYKHAKSHFFKRFSYLLLFVLMAQFILGISNVAFQIPIAIAVAHNVTGAALLVTLSLLFYSLKQCSEAS